MAVVGLDVLLGRYLYKAVELSAVDRHQRLHLPWGPTHEGQRTAGPDRGDRAARADPRASGSRPIKRGWVTLRWWVSGRAPSLSRRPTRSPPALSPSGLPVDADGVEAKRGATGWLGRSCARVESSPRDRLSRYGPAMTRTQTMTSSTGFRCLAHEGQAPADAEFFDADIAIYIPSAGAVRFVKITETGPRHVAVCAISGGVVRA